MGLSLREVQEWDTLTSYFLTKTYNGKEVTMRQKVLWITGLGLVGALAMGFNSARSESATQSVEMETATMLPLQVAAPSATAPAQAAPTAAPVVAAPAQAAPAAAAPTAVAPAQAAPTVAAPAAAATVPAAPVPTGDALVDKLNTQRYAVAPAMVATSALLKQSLEKGKSQAYQVQLPGPPYCQTFVAAAGDTVKDVTLVLESPAGAAEAQDAMQGSAAVIANHCPTVPGTYKLTVSMPSDAGEFAIQVFSK